jgi:murein DD-endopeptidase MepM/ murein hydrolase activator NlpD
VCGCIGNGFGGVKLFLQKSRNRPLRRALAWGQYASYGAGLSLAAAEAPRFPWKGRDGTGPAAPCALRAGAGEANANSSECPSFRGSDKEKTVTTLAARFVRTPTQVERSRFGAELGHEAPIEIDGSRIAAGRERRHIPLRWLVGVALAGLCGLALVGAALYLDLDSESTFAEAPEYAVATHREGASEDGVNPGKGDRLVRPIDIVAAKQTFKAPTTIKIGDKEVVKARPFTILSTTLTVTPTGFADAVPPFDPLKATSGSAEKADAPPDPGPVQDDAEVAFSLRDLSAADAAEATGELTLGEAQAQVAEMIKETAVGDKVPPLPPQMLLMRTSLAGVDPLGALSYAPSGGSEAVSAPFASIEVRMVPENVTEAVKSATEASPNGGERLVQMRHGDVFEDILRANGASKEAAEAILAAFGARAPIAEGQKIILEYGAPAADDKQAPIARVSVYADEQLKATIAINDAGAYVPVTLRAEGATRKPSDSSEADNGGMSLYQSFYETALKQGLQRPLIDEMVHAFANDVDFQRAVQPGDSIGAFVAEADDIDPHPQLLYATMTVRDQIFRYYRFQTPDDGLVDYYDENGRSTRKFLIRKPIVAGEITSPFGMRFHPILHYSRMHTGVDWGAPFGTPILAAGAGVVVQAEFTAGYGRRVEVQHANGYVTTYNHMSGFARGVVAGARVTQGQVIGYVGQTGEATGPHLHYEVIINGNFVDPMAIKLARTREFDGKMLTTFRRERDRIDQLMAQAPNAASAPAPSPAAVAAKVN